MLCLNRLACYLLRILIWTVGRTVRASSSRHCSVSGSSYVQRAWAYCAVGENAERKCTSELGWAKFGVLETSNRDHRLAVPPGAGVFPVRGIRGRRECPRASSSAKRAQWKHAQMLLECRTSEGQASLKHIADSFPVECVPEMREDWNSHRTKTWHGGIY